MAYWFSRTAGSLFRTGNAAITASPATFACWFNTWDVTNAQSLISVGATAANDEWRISNLATNALRANILGAGASVNATSANNVWVKNNWTHVAGTWTTSNEAIYGNGVNLASAAHSKTPTGVDRTHIAERANNLTANANGGIAEVGIWNVVLSDGEIMALAKGISPAFIRRANLIVYDEMRIDVRSPFRGQPPNKYDFKQIGGPINKNLHPPMIKRYQGRFFMNLRTAQAAVVRFNKNVNVNQAINRASTF